MRDPTCPDCRHVTSGDCGQHGPLNMGDSQVPFTMVASDGYVPTREQLLQARVDRLEADLRMAQQRIQALEQQQAEEPQK